VESGTDAVCAWEAVVAKLELTAFKT